MIDEDLSENDLNIALNLVYKHTHVKMTPMKKVLLRSRLRCRLSHHNLNHWSDYWKLVESDPLELDQFINLVTTHKTHFHRTSSIWEYFSKQFLPLFYKQNPKSTLRIWSAACSTGEEAYTSAMYCEEFWKFHPGFSYNIFASDISIDVLEFAKKAQYQEQSLDILKKEHPNFIQNYMESVDSNTLEVVPTIRSKVTFSQKNLFQHNIPRSSFDLVFLRNVLIYFDSTDQLKLVDLIKNTLSPSGVLIIGESESLDKTRNQMDFIQPLIYTQKKIA
jgi:chemotaxis protein methyltransferase CheR